MKIAVMGSGGVGGYFGAKLAHSGAEVHFIARGAHLAAMGEHGLRIESPTGDLTIQPVNATDNPAEIGPADIVLFAVKLYDTEVAAEACRPLLGPETAVVTFQNGIDGLGVLRRVLGDAHVAGGVTYIAAGIAAPGVIRQTGAMARLIFGELDGTPSSRLQVLLDQCKSAGIEAASRDPAGDLGEVRDALHHERSDDTGPPADRANPPGSADTRPGGGLPEGNGGRGESPWCRTAVRHHRAHHGFLRPGALRGEVIDVAGSGRRPASGGVLAERRGGAPWRGAGYRDAGPSNDRCHTGHVCGWATNARGNARKISALFIGPIGEFDAASALVFQTKGLSSA
jgi:hypothetical protein